jgi:pilus assembly protein CpaE
MMSTFTKDTDSVGSNIVSVALIGPDERRRRPLAAALAGLQGSVTREFASYPELDDLPHLLEADYDVIIVDLDSNTEHALDLVENIYGNSAITVMVYSEKTDPEMLVRCMRAGAREFLTQPITSSMIVEAMIRASVRRPSTRASKKAVGKLLVFAGAKGGAGVTTVATNFAVALAQESGQKTLLIDLGLPLGDAALELGITAQYSTANALQNFKRLDSNYLSQLLVKHRLGLSVLAAPDKYAPLEASAEAVEKLLSVARQDFDYVVVDAGSRFDSIDKALFTRGATVYFVLQVSISQLRNSNRLISELFISKGIRVEVVLNRYSPRVLEIDEASIAKALTIPVSWKIPNDYQTVQSAQNAAIPLVLEDSPISKVIRQMTRSACGLPAETEKKKRFNLFG